MPSIDSTVSRSSLSSEKTSLIRKPFFITMIRSWSSSPNQMIFLLSSLIQQPRPYGQSDEIPADLRYGSASMSLNMMWRSTSSLYLASSMKFGFASPSPNSGVIELIEPPNLAVSASNAASIRFSNATRSARSIAPGRLNAVRLRPTRTRIESSSFSPSFDRSSTPPSPTPDASQSLTCVSVHSGSFLW